VSKLPLTALTLALALVVVTGELRAQRFARLCDIPASLSNPPRSAYQARRGQLASELAALQRRGHRFNRECISPQVNSEAYRVCDARFTRLQSDKQSYNNRVRHLCRKVSLSMRVDRLAKRLESHKTAIRNMGFKTTARQFEDWAGRSEEWRDTFARSAAQAALGEMFTFAQGALKSKYVANKWANTGQMKSLEKKLAKLPGFGKQGPEMLRDIRTARTTAERARKAGELLAGAQTASTALLRKPELSMAYVAEWTADILGWFVNDPRLSRFMTWVSRADFAWTVVMSAYTIHQVDRGVTQLAKATEAQLRGLDKISRMIVQDMKDMKQAKARLARLH